MKTERNLIKVRGSGNVIVRGSKVRGRLDEGKVRWGEGQGK